MLPEVSFDRLVSLLPSAFTIAMLGAIESLLSAVVADGMAGTRHDSNQELIGQGIANVISPLLGGFAATGAIARTATNFRNGATSPLAGVVHALLHIPSAAAVAIGAIVSPPDSVAATAIARRVGMPRRIVTLLEGEAVFEGWAADRVGRGDRQAGLALLTNWRLIVADISGGFSAIPIAKVDRIELPSLTAMPAASWPRCCRAYSPK